MEAVAVAHAHRPDRLVFALHLLEQAQAEGTQFEGMQGWIDEATEANLTAATDLIVPEGFDPDTATPETEGAYAFRLHQWAFALSGMTADARRAVSQIGGSDPQGARHPGHVDELVAEVADRIAREQ